MADGINWNDVYKDYSSQYDQPKAIEYTVYGRLTGSKKVPKQYTVDEWLISSAPTYKSLAEYSGTDAASTYLKSQIVPLAKQGKFDLASVRTIVKTLTNPDGKNYKGDAYSYQEAYDLVKGVYDEVSKAQKSYALQPGLNWWKQYDLPDPKEKFDPSSTDSKKLFKPAEDYIAAQTKAYEKKKGTAAAKDFNIALRKAVYDKLAAAGATPFLVAAQQRIKSRG